VKDKTFESIILVLISPKKRTINKGKIKDDKTEELTFSETYEQLADATKMKLIKKDFTDPKNPKDMPPEEKPFDDNLFK